MTDDLLERFEACQFRPGELDHRTHVELAWRYLRRSSLLVALDSVSEGLKRFTRAVGAEDKYHQTVTWAFVMLINDRMRRLGPDHAWHEFEAHNPDLFSSEPSPLGRYYRPETLGSDLARQDFLLPDRLA